MEHTTRVHVVCEKGVDSGAEPRRQDMRRRRECIYRRRSCQTYKCRVISGVGKFGGQERMSTLKSSTETGEEPV